MIGASAIRWSSFSPLGKPSPQTVVSETTLGRPDHPSRVADSRSTTRPGINVHLLAGPGDFWDSQSMAMLVGYARVSTADQSLLLQRDALKKAGCKRIFSDVASGAKSERHGLAKALEFVRRGDTLVVWKLDRLGRSLAHLIESVRALQDRKVGFRSLQESLDTRTSGGKLVFHVFGALAEFERDIIRERTNAGLAAARARGRKGGRPRVLDAEKTALARTLHKEGTATAVICATLGVSRSSLYRYLGAPSVSAPTAPTPTRRPTARVRRAARRRDR